MNKYLTNLAACTFLACLAGCSSVLPWSEFSSGAFSTNLIYRMHDAPETINCIVVPENVGRSSNYTMHSSFYDALSVAAVDDTIMIVQNISIEKLLDVDRAVIVRGTNVSTIYHATNPPNNGNVMRTTTISDIYKEPQAEAQNPKRGTRQDAPAVKSPAISLDTIRILKNGRLALIGMVLNAEGKQSIIINEGELTISDCVLRGLRIHSTGGTVSVKRSVIEGWDRLYVGLDAERSNVSLRGVIIESEQAGTAVRTRGGALHLERIHTPGIRYEVDSSALVVKNANVNEIQGANGASISYDSLQTTRRDYGIFDDGTVDVRGDGSIVVSTPVSREAALRKQRRAEEERRIAEQRQQEEERRAEEVQRKEREKREAERRRIVQRYSFSNLNDARNWLVDTWKYTDGVLTMYIIFAGNGRWEWTWIRGGNIIDKEFKGSYLIHGVVDNIVNVMIRTRDVKQYQIYRVGDDALTFGDVKYERVK